LIEIGTLMLLTLLYEAVAVGVARLNSIGTA